MIDGTGVGACEEAGRFSASEPLKSRLQEVALEQVLSREGGLGGLGGSNSLVRDIPAATSKSYKRLLREVGPNAGRNEPPEPRPAFSLGRSFIQLLFRATESKPNREWRNEMNPSNARPFEQVGSRS